MDKYEQGIVDFFEKMKNQCLEKYRKGKFEHGDDLYKINCAREIFQEVKDIINYHIIDLIKKGEIF